MTESNIEILRLEHITKRFGGVTALNDVGLQVNVGEIHAVVGENGAGKSTMMKLLAGVEQPDNGKIFINGKEVQISSPKVSEDFGIAMVFQELNLFPPLSVAANIFITNELKTASVFLNENAMYLKAKEILSSLMVDIDPRTKVRSLNTGNRQIVDIARAIFMGTKVIIMDEPNSALNQFETKALFDIIFKLKSRGITIMYVSHRLEEVFTIADRISVLRDGRYIGTWDKEKTSIEEIVSNVVGRKLGEIFPIRPVNEGPRKKILSVSGLQINENTKPIQFEVIKGEVLGFAGLSGSGIEDVFKILFGLKKTRKPFVMVYKGQTITKQTPSDLIKKGWAYIPASRREEGLMLDWSILKNVSLVIIEKLINRFGLLDLGKENRVSRQYISQFSISTDSLQKKANNLSGGNQQKVVLAKWLATNPNLLILNDPTRGIDVGTKQEIYRLMSDWAQKGFTILWTSSEIEEILGMSDRIFVFYKGSFIREFNSKQVLKEEVMRYVLSGEELEDSPLNVKPELTTV